MAADPRSLERGFQRGEKAAGRFEASVKGSSGRATQALKNVSKAGVLGVAGALGGAVKVAASFEKQMSSLGSVSGATAKQMAQFRKQALKAGADTAFSAKEAAVAQTELAKAGLSVVDIMKGGLDSALGLAAAGELELADAATYTANAMNLFGLKGKESVKVADALATAANVTTGDVSDFGAALVQSGSVAKSAGLSFNSTVVALEALASSGIKGSDAGTSLKTALIQLIKPTDKQAGLAKSLGLSFVDAQGKMKGLGDISGMLRKKLGEQGQAQRTATLATLAGTDGVRTLTALYDAGPAKLSKYAEGLNKQGTAAEVAKRKQDNLAGSLEQLGGSVETIGIQVGSVLIPKLTSGADTLTKFVNQMQSGRGPGGRLAAAIKDVGSVVVGTVKGIRDLARGYQEGNTKAVVLVGTLASLVAGFTAFKVITGVVTAMKALKAAILGVNLAIKANTVVLVVSALVALGVGLTIAYKKSETFRRIVDTTFRVMKTVAGDAISFVLRAFDKYLGGISSVLSAAGKIPGVGGKFRQAAKGIDEGREKLRGVADAMDDLGKKKPKRIDVNVRINYRELLNGQRAAGAPAGAIGPGGLGDGIGRSVRRIATATGRRRAPSIAPPLQTAPGAASGALMGANSALSPIARVGAGFGLSVSSGKRASGGRTSSGGISYHGSGEAIDLAGSPAGMKRTFSALKARFGPRLAELIHTPSGTGIKNGKPYTYGGAVAAQHYDHVHAALDLGSSGPGIGNAASYKATGDGPGLDAGQTSIARQILAVGQRLRASPRVLLAAIEAGLVESNLRNLNYGDRDSVGVFQQRPSQGWKGLRNVKAAAAEFISKAKAANTGRGSAGQLAQAVQRSAFPGRYDERRGQAQSIIRALMSSKSPTSSRTSRTSRTTSAAKSTAVTVSKFARTMDDLSVVLAKAEATARPTDDIAALLFQRKATTDRLRKVTRALKKGGLRPETRQRLTQEAASLIGDRSSMSGRIGDLRKLDPKTGKERPDVAESMRLLFEADQERKAEARAKAISDRGSFASSGMAMAQLTRTLTDDVAAQYGIATDAYMSHGEAIARFGASSAEATEALVRLSQAQADYGTLQQEAARQPFRDGISGLDDDLIRAMVDSPDDKADDLAVVRAQLAQAEAGYQSAIANADAEGIKEFGQNVLSLRESVKSLEEATTANQDAIAEALKGFTDELKRQNDLASSQVGIQNSQLVKALADILSGQIVGVGLQGRTGTAGVGGTVSYGAGSY